MRPECCKTFLSPGHSLWFQVFDHLLILQATPFADEARPTNRLLGRIESCWKRDSEEFFHTVSSFNMLPVCLDALRTHMLSSGINW